MVNIRSKRKVAMALKKYARTMEDWVRPVKNIRKFRGSTANSFLLGVMFNRSIPYGRAWDTGDWINDTMGDPDDPAILWKNLTNLENKRLIGFLRYGYGGKAFHRHYKTYARQLPEFANIIIHTYKGDPRNIWNSERDIAETRNKFEELPGIGPALSRMAVLILARNYGLLGGKGSLPQLDIKPDDQLMRVFRRTGLIQVDGDRDDAVEIAQKLSEKFPAELDAPSWVIGREWCRPKKTKCGECPIENACPKIKLR